MQTLFAYPETTTSTQAASEVPTSSGGATEGHHVTALDLPGARCAGKRTLSEWVPSGEERLVPAELTAICRSCPVRQACLTAATEEALTGYYAATTSSDRRRLRARDQVTLTEADRLQDEIFDEEYPDHNHSGPPSLIHYSHGCRGAECRALRAAYRAKLRNQVPSETTAGLTCRPHSRGEER